MTKRIYLDHAATTPVIAEARDAFTSALDAWSNPNSPHFEGRASRSILEAARESLKRTLGWTGAVVFCSGASEAVEIAAARARVNGRIHGASEHAIVPHAMGPTSRVVPVGRDGLIDEAALDEALAAGTALVAIQHVNNETGVIQPIERIAVKVRAAGSLLLADCAQSASKVPLPDADFLAICAHKLGGPPGIGALLVRDLSNLEPAGGGQEQGFRRGTQDVPSAAAFAAALDARPYDMVRLASLRERLERGIEAAGGTIIAASAPRIPTIGAISLQGATSMALLAALDLAGFAVSAGSACSSGKAKASAVLAAMGVPDEVAAGYLRISFGPQTSTEDVDSFVDAFTDIVRRRRRAAAA